jgi:CBS domain containing-hemolysin-like protein
MTPILLIILFIATIALSAFCSGTETGLLSIPRARLLPLTRQKENKAKKRLVEIINNLPNAITTLLVANNIANVTLSTVSATLAIHFFPQSQSIQSAWACVTAILTLFLGEYLPKLLFSTKPLRRTLAVTGIFHVIEVILYPIVWCFSIFTHYVFKIKISRPSKQSISRDALRFIVADRHDSTHLSSFERLLIDRVLTLQATTAGELAHPPEEDEVNTTLKISSLTRGDDILPAMRKKHQRVASVIDPITFEPIGVITEEDVLLLLTGVLKEG